MPETSHARIVPGMGVAPCRITELVELFVYHSISIDSVDIYYIYNILYQLKYNMM